ncbi:MAG: nucleotidyltransferase domain-containing protein [Candidatus Omnitrophica bacterium]|nr:nucleotidyltransferase domain-containing protein [Candidatus Omnitrophota bacterium]
MAKLEDGHLAEIKRILTSLVPEYEVRIYGSRVNGSARSYSDVDLAVKGDGPLNAGVLEKLKDSFAASDLPMRVDVLDWHDTSEAFQKIISQNCEVIQEAKLSS